MKYARVVTPLLTALVMSACQAVPDADIEGTVQARVQATTTALAAVPTATVQAQPTPTPTRAPTAVPTAAPTSTPRSPLIGRRGVVDMDINIDLPARYKNGQFAASFGLLTASEQAQARLTLADELPYGFVDLASYRSFFGAVRAGILDTYVATEQRLATDGKVILLNGGEPVTVTNVSDADTAYEVDLVSGRRVWLSSHALR